MLTFRRGMDPVEALADFKKRVKMYENSYQPLGDYEEKQGMPYIKVKIIGFRWLHLSPRLTGAL